MTVITIPTSRPTHQPTTPAVLDLDALAAQVESGGVRHADPRGIAELARRARARGASRVLVEVLTSKREPDVARVRAFARLSSLLALRAATTVPQQR